MEGKNRERVSDSIFLHNGPGLSGTFLDQLNLFLRQLQLSSICSAGRFLFLFHPFYPSLLFSPLPLPPPPPHSLQALAGEMLRDVQEVKQQLTETRSRRKRSRRRHEEANAARGAPTAKSMIRAKSIAASILNMSERDLADMLDGDQVHVTERREGV